MLDQQRAELEQVKAERDQLKSLNERIKRDYDALRTISDKYNGMLRNVWKYKTRHYENEIAPLNMRAAMVAVDEWEPLHEQYAKLIAKKH